MRSLLPFSFLVLALAAGPARAQPDRGDAGAFAPGRSRPRGDSRPGAFDFYVLALSWSPGFCATQDGGRERDQCRQGADLGFTLHGLWPQYDRGFPSDCRGDTRPPATALATTDGLYPDRGLARYEWRRHGTCSGLSPAGYFAAARAARDAVAVPVSLRDPHRAQVLSPDAIERAFTDANSRLRPGMLAVTCRDGTLEEVRICLSRDLKSFQACPEVAHSQCRAPSVIVPPVR